MKKFLILCLIVLCFDGCDYIKKKENIQNKILNQQTLSNDDREFIMNNFRLFKGDSVNIIIEFAKGTQNYHATIEKSTGKVIKYEMYNY